MFLVYSSCLGVPHQVSARDQPDNDLTCSCDLNEVVGAWRLVPDPRYLAHGRTIDTL